MRNSRILGTGMYLPERVVTNHDLEAITEMETSDEWIQQRSGIESRRHVDDGLTGAEMGFTAAKQAIENAGMTPDDIDFIIFATLSPDVYFPGNGVFLQDMLFGDRTVGALDVRNQCSGFIYSLSMADSLVKSEQYDNVLIVGAEVHSVAMEFTKRGRDISVLFGDGAGSVVVGPAQEGHAGILGTSLHSEGKYAQDLWLEAPTTRGAKHITHEHIDEGRIYPKMNGRTVFKHAVTRMIEVAHEELNKAGLTIEDVDLVIPHQANLRINQFVASQLGVPEEKVVNTIQWTGNTTAATIPICMCEALKQGRLKENDLILLLAFGSGFTWASALLKW